MSLGAALLIAAAAGSVAATYAAVWYFTTDLEEPDYEPAYADEDHPHVRVARPLYDQEAER